MAERKKKQRRAGSRRAAGSNMKILFTAMSICALAAAYAQTGEFGGAPESRKGPPHAPRSGAQNAADGAGRQNPLIGNPAETRRGSSPNGNSHPANATQAELPNLEGAETLLGRNPFGNAPSTKTTKDAKNDVSLQLTSVCCIDGKWNFVVTDAASKASYALPLKGRITEELPYRVDFFDEETMSVSVSNSVAEYVLTLKTPDEPAAAPAPQAAAQQAAQNAQQQQRSARQNYNNFRPWFPPPRVEVPTAKRINRR